LEDSTYRLTLLIVETLGIILLLIYVIKTWTIAAATVKHNKILTTPIITMRILNKGEKIGNREIPSDGPLKRVSTFIENHTPLHANIKIAVKYHGVINNVEFTDRVQFGPYGGHAIWEFAAKERFVGNFTVEEFEELDTCSEEERVYLDIILEARPYNSTLEFKRIPQKQYYWNGSSKNWIPSPVPEITPGTESES